MLLCAVVLCVLCERCGCAVSAVCAECCVSAGDIPLIPSIILMLIRLNFTFLRGCFVLCECCVC